MKRTEDGRKVEIAAVAATTTSGKERENITVTIDALVAELLELEGQNLVEFTQDVINTKNLCIDHKNIDYTVAMVALLTIAKPELRERWMLSD